MKLEKPRLFPPSLSILEATNLCHAFDSKIVHCGIFCQKILEYWKEIAIEKNSA